MPALNAHNTIDTKTISSKILSSIGLDKQPMDYRLTMDQQVRMKDDEGRSRLEQLAEEWVHNYLQGNGISKHSQMSRLIQKVSERATDYTLKNGCHPETLKTELHQACDLISYIRATANAQYVSHSMELAKWIVSVPEGTEPDPKHLAARAELEGRVWRHYDPIRAFEEGLNSSESVAVNADELEEYIKEYITHKWLRSTFLEWVFIDALIYSEIIAFGDAIKLNAPGPSDFLGNKAYFTSKGKLKAILEAELYNKLAWSAGKLFIPPLLACGCFYLASLTNITGLLIAGFIIGAPWLLIVSLKLVRSALSYILSLFGKRPDNIITPFEANVRLWSKMKDVYLLLKGNILNPQLIRDELIKTKTEGAVWKNSIYALIGLIIARNPETWIIEY